MIRRPKSVLLAGAMLAYAAGAHAQSQTVTAEKPLVVSETTKLSSLSIAQNAEVTAPSGNTVSLVVDGVERPIRPGDYAGQIVLLSQPNLTLQTDLMGSSKAAQYRAAVLVRDGRYLPTQSVAAALSDGLITDGTLKGGIIRSEGDAPRKALNGVIVAGDSHFTVDNTVIRLKGNAEADFLGIGAGIGVRDKSVVNITGVRIENSGVMRTAIWAADNSIINLRRVEIDGLDGYIPPERPFAADLDSMIEAPWVLGLRGNSRGLLLLNKATANIYDSHIRVQRWGALSTDGTEHIRMNVFNTRIEVTDSGYGAMTIGDCITTFNGSNFDVASMGLYMLGSGAAVFNGTTVKSRGFGVVSEGAFGASGYLTIRNGSRFQSALSLIQLKGSTPQVLIDRSELVPGNGVILESFPNDDPFFTSLPPGAPEPAGPPMPKPDYLKPATGPVVTIRSSKLIGDLLDGDSDKRDMTIELDKSTLRGAISLTTAVHRQDPQGRPFKVENSDLVHLIGRVDHRLEQPSTSHQLVVRIGGGSAWLVTRTSFLSDLTIARGSKIAAANGRKVRMSVNGREVRITPGRYTGKIVLTVF